MGAEAPQEKMNNAGWGTEKTTTGRQFRDELLLSDKCKSGGRMSEPKTRTMLEMGGGRGPAGKYEKKKEG